MARSGRIDWMDDAGACQSDSVALRSLTIRPDLPTHTRTPVEGWFASTITHWRQAPGSLHRWTKVRRDIRLLLEYGNQSDLRSAPSSGDRCSIPEVSRYNTTAILDGPSMAKIVSRDGVRVIRTPIRAARRSERRSIPGMRGSGQVMNDTVRPALLNAIATSMARTPRRGPCWLSSRIRDALIRLWKYVSPPQIVTGPQLPSTEIRRSGASSGFGKRVQHALTKFLARDSGCILPAWPIAVRHAAVSIPLFDARTRSELNRWALLAP